MTSLGTAQLINVPLSVGSSSIPTQSVSFTAMGGSSISAIPSIQTINLPPASTSVATTTVAGMTVYQVPAPTTTVIPVSSVTVASSAANVVRTTIPVENPLIFAAENSFWIAKDGTRYYLLKGTAIPQGWTKELKSTLPTSPAGEVITTIEDDIIAIEEEALKFLFSEQVGKAVLIIGSAGIVYISYLWIARPQDLKAFIMRFTELKTLFVDASQLMAAIAVIIGLGFVSYEFAVSYERKGSIPEAIADMGARAIETLISVIFDVIGDLLSDLWAWLKKELKDIFTFNISV